VIDGSKALAMSYYVRHCLVKVMRALNSSIVERKSKAFVL